MKISQYLNSNKFVISRVPQHIAIIPDGNRRWAVKRGLRPYKGHLYGAKALEEILETAYRFNIRYFSFWIASLDNLLKRPKIEIDYLFKLFERKFTELKNNPRVYKEEVRIRIIGFWQKIVPDRLKKIFKQTEEQTKNFSKYNLTFLMGYNGDMEMLEAIKEALVHNEPINPHFSEESLRKYLLTGELPDIDLLIRTGGEPHLSTGFMMWHMRYAQLYFTDTLWPDFKASEFLKAIKDYSQRERRFGK